VQQYFGQHEDVEVIRVDVNDVVYLSVVLDRKADKLCDTGLFELIYRQQPISEPPQLDTNLCVEGRKVMCPFSTTRLP